MFSVEYVKLQGGACSSTYKNLFAVCSMSVQCPMCSSVVYQTGCHRPTNRHAAPHQNRHVSSRFSLTLLLLLFVCPLPIAHLPLPNDYCLLPITNCPSKQEKCFSITLFLFVCLLLFCSLDFTSKDVTQSEIRVCNRHIFLLSWPQSSFRVLQDLYYRCHFLFASLCCLG